MGEGVDCEGPGQKVQGSETVSFASWYERRVFPWLNDRLGGCAELERIRTEALSAATGRVLEIGFGSGANLTHYPDAVASVTALEPNHGMHDRAVARIRASRIPVFSVVGQGEALPFLNGSFDTAVSTLTLCSVADLGHVLSELRRVLRPDGRLLLVEHGLSSDPAVARWQGRLNGIQNVVACGCHLNRAIAASVVEAGFRFETVRQFYAEGIPRTHGWITVGEARPENG